MAIAISDAGSAMVEKSSVLEQMDEAAFQDLYQTTAPVLRAFIRRATRDAALADDIFQETFYRFLRANLPALERRQMKAYLYRTAMSLLSDHWRRLQRERRWRLGMLFAKPTVETNLVGGDVERLFGQLKPQEQALLWLAYVEGFDHREIAAALQVQERSVRVLLFRARKRLVDILTKAGFAPEGGR